MSRAVHLLSIAVIGLHVFGCSSEPSSSSSSGEPTTVVSQVVLTPSSNDGTVRVEFSGMRAHETNWISIAPPNAPADDFRFRSFTSATSGLVTFGSVPPGTYEARAHEAGGTDPNEVTKRSAPFVVVSFGTPSLATNATFGAKLPITVDYTGMRATTDWVGLYIPGAPDASFIAKQYLSVLPNGEVVFTGGLPAGTYVARSFYADTFERAAESATFSVTEEAPATGTLTTAASFDAGAAIKVDYTGLGGPTAWIGLYAPGAPDATFISSVNAPAGVASGSVLFPNGLPAGSYVARSFAAAGFNRLAQSTQFTVNALPSVVVTGTPAHNTPIPVDFAHFPPSASNAITIAIAGTAADQWVALVNTPATASGTVSLPALPGGNYEVRGYFDWTGAAPFTVRTSASFSIPFGPISLSVGGNPLPSTAFSVGFDGFPLSSSNWISVATPGSAPEQYLARMDLPYGTTGSVSFAGLAAGTYELRGFFDWAGTQSYTVRATLPLTVVGVQIPTGLPLLRLSSAPNGNAGNGRSMCWPQFASDRYFAFQSFSSDFLPGDTNMIADVFLFDRHTSQMKWISVGNGLSAGYSPVISPDEARVLFFSTRPLIAGAPQYAMYSYAIATDTLSWFDDGVSDYNFYFSSSGRYVSYTKETNAPVSGGVDKTWQVCVYDFVGNTKQCPFSQTQQVRDSLPTTGTELHAVGIGDDGLSISYTTKQTLPTPHSEWRFRAADGTTTVLGDAPTGDTSMMTGDARYFSFSKPLGPRVQVFRLDRTTGVTELVSRKPDAAPSTGNHFNARMSPDGRYFAWLGYDAADLGLGTGAPAAFVRDLDTGVLRISNLESPSHFCGVTKNGAYVLGATATPIGTDTNGDTDVFVGAVLP
jgi:hypothetical protein